MLTFDSIQSKLRTRLQDIHLVKDGVVRCVRKYDSKPISFYYFDFSEKIEDISANLKSYQDEILSRDFFSTTGELQWNYYLVFVLSNAVFQKQKDTDLVTRIQKDKLFSRKFVLPEDELESFLDVPILSDFADESPTSDLSARWCQRLDEVGLSSVYGRAPRSETIRRYLGGESISGTSAVENDFSSELDSVGRKLIELQLKSYRPYPLKREFEFGAMNLLVGPNGTGKTSLLEAIELIYCGATLRGEGKPEPTATIHFKLENDIEFGSYDFKANKKYQQRDLIWYGQSTSKGNDLFSSFNKYNFYNADSAYKLANETSDEEIESAFTALALGEKANHIDRRLRDFLSDFEGRLGAQVKQLKILEESFSIENEKATKYAQIETESNKLFTLFIQSAQKIPFINALPQSLEPDGLTFSKMLMELKAKLDEIVLQSSITSRFTPDAILLKFKQLQQAMIQIEDLNKGIEDSRKEYLKNENDKKTNHNLFLQMKRLRNYLEEDRHLRIVGISDKYQAMVTKLSVMTKILELKNKLKIADIESIDLSSPIAELVRAFSNKVIEAEGVLRIQEGQYIKNQDLWTSNQKLVSNIIDLSLKMIHSNPEIENCPVCNAHYKKGQLKNIINEVISSKESESLIKERANIESFRNDLQAKTIKLRNLQLIQEIYSISKVIFFFSEESAKAILETIDRELASHSELSATCQQLKGELSTFSALGLSENEYTNLRSKVIHDDVSLDLIDKEILRISEIVANDSKDEDRIKGNIEQRYQEKIKISHQFIIPSQFNESTFESELQLMLGSLKHLTDLVSDISKQIVIAPSDDLASLHRDIENLNRLMSNVVKAKGDEQRLEIELNLAKKRKAELSHKVDEEKAVLDKIKTAYDLIQDILNQDGKEQALAAFINKNRARIDNIFSRIHSPKEFKGLIPGTTKLMRIGDDNPTPLNRVSTGQRAALALSVFFALNLSLKKAPPVILIDDPVAHVDDLNTLSFLDFLREIVVRSNRQIFFATASQKLASLIEKKFCFLDDQFKRFEFSR